MAARASGGGSNEALKPRAQPEPEPEPKVVQTFVSRHGQTVGLLDNNPRGLPVVRRRGAAWRCTGARERRAVRSGSVGRGLLFVYVL